MVPDLEPELLRVPFSRLLGVVHRKRTWVRHTFRDGILVTILQQTPEEAHDEVTGSHPGLNDALGGWVSIRPLYDPSRLLGRLQQRAEKPTAQQFRGPHNSTSLKRTKTLESSGTRSKRGMRMRLARWRYGSAVPRWGSSSIWKAWSSRQAGVQSSSSGAAGP